MDRAQGPTKLSTPPWEVEDYYKSDSSSPSVKHACQSATEPESSKTVVMPIMIIGRNDLEEEMTAMKAMLERLVKESEEKEARIKLQEEKITRLTKKLEKWPARSLAKILESKQEERASVESGSSDEEVH